MAGRETLGYDTTVSLDVLAIDMQKTSGPGAVFLLASSCSFESQRPSSVQRTQYAKFGVFSVCLKSFKVLNVPYLCTTASRCIDG